MVLSDDNFLLYAMHNYTAPSCPTLEEFENDLKTLVYIKKLLNKDSLQTRLILNHIIVLFNCFQGAALHMLFYRIEKQHWGTLVTFLLYLNRMPETIPEYNLRLTDVVLNETVIADLRNL